MYWQLLTMNPKVNLKTRLNLEANLELNLVLASSSKYRAQLLKEAGLNPLIIKPKIDEDAIKIEFKDLSPLHVAQKLAELKAEDIVANTNLKFPFIVIGSDQVCVFDNQIFDKPGTFESNFTHLKKLQGQTHKLITCVCLIYQKDKNSKSHRINFFDHTELKMKSLTDDEIKTYLNLDQPYDCAGGYRFESEGHKLMTEVLSEDKTAIQGLPMVATLKHLKNITTQLGCELI